jgi:hypothetical protein
MMEHAFTPTIIKILREEFDIASTEVFEKSLLLHYLNFKTRSANRGSKARGAYASLYALYVLAEDYVNKGYVDTSTYETYKGAQFSELLRRVRELPFGSKLQNHALNTRLNGEFLKFFPTSDHEPVLRNLDTKRYWINEHLLIIPTSDHAQYNIARSIVRIIDAYIEAKKDAFASFFEDCKNIETLRVEQPDEARRFIEGLIRPNVDARLFEIVSFSILKAYYGEQSIYWGWQRDSIREEPLILYKTGRTNANDGGIDFVMKPIGRFFQVTETMDVNKYFLDIEKVQRFPLTFVVKSVESVDEIRSKMRLQARRKYPVKATVDRYMSCIEEVINIPDLLGRFDAVVKKQALAAVMSEIINQSKIEFNIDELNEAEIDAMEGLMP